MLFEIGKEYSYTDIQTKLAKYNERVERDTDKLTKCETIGRHFGMGGEFLVVATDNEKACNHVGYSFVYVDHTDQDIYRCCYESEVP